MGSPGNRRLLSHCLVLQKGLSPLRRVSDIHRQVQCTGEERIPLSPRERTCRTQPGGTEVQRGQSMSPSQLLEVSEYRGVQGWTRGSHPALFLMEMCTLPAPGWMETGERPAPQALLDPELLTQRPLYPTPFHWGFRFPLRHS